MNLARLNHILIPQHAAARERFRTSRAGRFLTPMFDLGLATTRRGRSAILLLLLVGILSLEVRISQGYFVWCVLAGCLAGAVAVRRRAKLPGVEVTVGAVGRVTVGQFVSFRITVRNRSQNPYEDVRVRGPFLPWDGSWDGKPAEIPLLLPGATHIVESRARFVERGEHHLEPFSATRLALFGFFDGPPAESSDVRFCVLPRVATVASLSLLTPPLRQPGGWGTRQLGDGQELLGVRPYRAGDPVRLLHARTWARTGRPTVRQYAREQTPKVALWVDSGARRTTHEQFEAALSLAAGVVSKLCRTEVVLDSMVVGARLHRLGLGANVSELALAALGEARLDRSPRAVSDGVGILRDELSRLGGLVVVLLADDEERLSIEDLASRAGVRCRTLVVLPGAATRPLDRNASGRIQVSVREVEAGGVFWL